MGLFERPIRKHTRPGDVCYEPFCESGSQIIAAERTVMSIAGRFQRGYQAAALLLEFLATKDPDLGAVLPIARAKGGLDEEAEAALRKLIAGR